MRGLTISQTVGLSPRNLARASEEAVYLEFERISERGGGLDAMGTMYQRSKIPDESMYYGQKKRDESLPLIGLNSFLGGHE